MDRALALGLTLFTFAGCASIQSATLRGNTAPANDAFLVEVTDIMPGEPYGFVSVATLKPGRTGGLPERLSEDALAAFTEVAAKEGAEVLVTERLDNRRQQLYYGFGLKRMTPPGQGLAGVKPCTHVSLASAVQDAVTQTQRCLKSLQRSRKGLQGRVRVITLVDGLGGVYRAAVAPDATRDGQMGACGLDAAHETDFGGHEDVLCRVEFEATL